MSWVNSCNIQCWSKQYRLVSCFYSSSRKPLWCEHMTSSFRWNNASFCGQSTSLTLNNTSSRGRALSLSASCSTTIGPAAVTGRWSAVTRATAPHSRPSPRRPRPPNHRNCFEVRRWSRLRPAVVSGVSSPMDCGGHISIEHVLWWPRPIHRQAILTS